MNDEHAAASSVISFLVAGTLFMVGVGAVLLAGDDAGDRLSQSGEAEGLHLSAGSLSTLLLHSSGFGVGSGDWIDNPDSLGRLGLKESDSDLLDFDKFQNLRLAALAASSEDGRVNYPEALESLGLSEAGLDFHVRAFPSLKAVEDLLGTGKRDPNLRVTYVGHQISTGSGGGALDAGLTVGAPTCSVVGNAYRFQSTITNGGLSDALFQARFHITMGTNSVSESAHGFVVPMGNSQIFYVDVPNAAGARCQAGDEIEVEVWDSSTQLTTETTVLSSSPGTPTAAIRQLFVDPSSLTHSPSSKVEIEYGGGLSENDVLDIEVYEGDDDTGTLIWSNSITVPKQQNKWDFDVPAGILTGPEYRIYAEDGSGTRISDRIAMGNAPTFTPTSGGVSVDWADSVAIETKFLDELVEQFCMSHFDSKADSPDTNWVLANWTDRCSWHDSAVPGDVFPDEKSVVNNDLRARIWDDATSTPRYDLVNTIVVGSDVAHNSMTSNSIKGPLGEWVFQGGTLIVFGHDSKNVQWMQSIFHAGVESSSGGISTPDGSHPMLHVADDLAYSDYDNRDKTWKFNSGSDALFDPVVIQDESPILAVSKPGVIGSGNVVLTTWLPYDLFGTGEDSGLEGFKLVNNLLMQGYRDLFLDYGPPIPEGQGNVIPAAGVARIAHPDFEEPIELTMQIYVFPTS